MGIISRAFHVGRSHVNAVVDWAGDPEKSLRLLIQDMEDALVKARASAIEAVVERKSLERRLALLQTEVREWQERAEAAVLSGRDDLAAEALQAKARSQAALAMVDERLDRLSHSLEQQGEDMLRLQTKLQEAKLRETTARSLHRTASSRLSLRKKSFDYRIERAFAKLADVEGALDDVEGRAEAYDIARHDELSMKLSRLAIETSARQELSELKKRMGGQIALETPAH